MMNMKVQMSCDDAQGKAVSDVVISAIHDQQIRITDITAELLGQLLAQTWIDIQAQFPKKTGATANHIKLNQLGPMSWEIAVEGGQYVKIFNYIEYGTAGHGPVQAAALHWIDEEGNDVFARFVRGIPAHLIVRVALEKLAMQLNDLARRATA